MSVSTSSPSFLLSTYLKYKNKKFDFYWFYRFSHSGSVFDIVG